MAHKPIVTKPAKKDLYVIDPQEAQKEKIRAVYKDKPYKVHDIVGPKEKLRAKILEMSLFPNVFNRATIMRYGE
jgi:hypothetical protein